jgi:hypothetical protein
MQLANERTNERSEQRQAKSDLDGTSMDDRAREHVVDELKVTLSELKSLKSTRAVRHRLFARVVRVRPVFSHSQTNSGGSSVLSRSRAGVREARGHFLSQQ